MARILTGSGWRSGHIKGTVYSSQDAFNQVGDGAMEAFQDRMAQALDVTAYDYTIYGIKSEHPNLGNENVNCSNCGDGALDYFFDYLDGSPVRRSKDFNLIITGADYGTKGCESGNFPGCGGGDGAAIEGAAEIAELYGTSPSMYVPDNTRQRAVHGGLHEVGHNLGMSHNDGEIIESPNGHVTQSPHGSANKAQNSCGHSNQSGSIERLLIGYVSCEISNITVA